MHVTAFVVLHVVRANVLKPTALDYIAVISPSSSNPPNVIGWRNVTDVSVSATLVCISSSIVALMHCCS